MVDRDLVLRRIAALDEYLLQLADYRDIDLETYQSDWKTQRIIERTLQLVVESCMDLADHIVADERLKVPDTAAAAFESLAEHGILTGALGRSLGRMVGFRNILVHEYARLDSAIVLRVLRQDLGDIQAFREAILRYLYPSGPSTSKT